MGSLRGNAEEKEKTYGEIFGRSWCTIRTGILQAQTDLGVPMASNEQIPIAGQLTIESERLSQDLQYSELRIVPIMIFDVMCSAIILK